MIGALLPSLALTDPALGAKASCVIERRDRGRAEATARTQPIRNGASGLCVDSKHGATGTELRLDTCLKEGAERTWAHEQIFTFGWREDIRPGDPLHTRKFCFDAISQSSAVTLFDCHGMKGNQYWSYRRDQSLYHLVSGSCMDCSPRDKRIFTSRCDPESETQRWLFQHVNATVLDKFNSS
ncbi:hypothetical protein Z043_103664 [Scleropages formosus]|uniref:polypeptide N-acetylgalactosaminyltransferase n=1 Tax=Scleropages formosus TaxID=113540 RepID=A0A0P7V5H3_SCLFO|nr:hypothetical protein Z043_103664 [Scleropages formosus]